MTEQTEKPVPGNMMVACPLKKGGLISIEPSCTDCKFHKGIIVLNPDDRLPWRVRHSIACSLPRQLGILEKVDG